MSAAETADELAMLENEAAAIDADASAAEPVAQPAEVVAAPDAAAEVAAVLQAAAAILSPAFPSLATIYTPETCRQLGDAAAPVLAKYDLSVGGLFDRWGPEITLAASVLPVAIATHRGIKADIAARRAPPEKPAETTPE